VANDGDDDDERLLDEQEAEDFREALRVLAMVKAHQEKMRGPYLHEIGPYTFNQPYRYTHRILEWCEQEGWLKSVEPFISNLILYEITDDGLQLLVTGREKP
jgi:hypothetical protein